MWSRFVNQDQIDRYSIGHRRSISYWKILILIFSHSCLVVIANQIFGEKFKMIKFIGTFNILIFVHTRFSRIPEFYIIKKRFESCQCQGKGVLGRCIPAGTSDVRFPYLKLHSTFTQWTTWLNGKGVRDAIVLEFLFVAVIDKTLGVKIVFFSYAPWIIEIMCPWWTMELNWKNIFFADDFEIFWLLSIWYKIK